MTTPRTAPRFARASRSCRKGSARTFIRTSASASIQSFSGGCSGSRVPSGNLPESRLLQSTELAPFADPSGEAVGRHAAELLPAPLAHSRSRPSDPRRTHDRRRSAVAAAILGIDRPHAVASRGHERRGRHRLHGRGRAVRYARRHDHRQGPGRRLAGRSEGQRTPRPSKTPSSPCCRKTSGPGTPSWSSAAPYCRCRAGDHGA